MSFSDLLEKIGRGVFEAPFGAISQLNDSPEIAEIRFAILDEIKRKTQRAGGRDIFPYNLIRVSVRGVGDSQTAVLEGEFFRNYFEQEVRQQLLKTNARYPEDLHIEVRVRNILGDAGKQWIWVETLSEAPLELPAARERTPARLLVMRGNSNLKEITLTKTRTNIGRVVDVFKAEGLSRRNDLAFAEDTAINKTVSREHAHILYHRDTDEYRLYNDRWYKRGDKTNEHCGIWIVRDGMGQEVHRDTRGTRLENGDEIHFGKAVVEFHLGA
jgi:hypothetical protein